MIDLLTILAIGYQLDIEILIMAETQEEILAQKVRELQKKWSA